MLKTATQVTIMSCLWPFSSGSGKPWRWPWTTGAQLKQTTQHNKEKTMEKTPEFIFSGSILAWLSQYREINPAQV